jgi:8-oxo-dGTP pyrophosphatase MutT (NUDIX family)
MIKKPLLKIISKVALQPIYRQTRGLTLGTRTAVFDVENRVLLVQHSYGPGWLLPGGGVERGETIFDSAKRETREEAGIIAEEEPVLKGICLNDRQFPGDHVAVLTLHKFTQAPWEPTLEITHAKFFAIDQLPDGTTGGTRRRLDEIISNQEIARHW